MFNALRGLRIWLAQVADPVRAFRGLVAYPQYLVSWYRYAHLPNAERIRLYYSCPQLHDRTDTSPLDAHYFYANGWAMRRIVASAAQLHVDIGSQTILANLLGSVIQTIYVDYRPLVAKLSRWECVGGNLVSLPFADRSISSLSCCHVIEHVGLGRYGDPLDPEGTKKAGRELTRVLAAGGNLFLAVPVGRSRLCFNAHRMQSAESIRELFEELDLIEFSGIHDDGRYVERVQLSEFRESEYACGLFWLQSKR